MSVDWPLDCSICLMNSWGSSTLDWLFQTWLLSGAPTLQCSGVCLWLMGNNKQVLLESPNPLRLFLKYWTACQLRPCWGLLHPA